MLSAAMGISASHRQRARRFMLSNVTNDAVNTFGWDTVFAIRLDQVNERIRQEKSSPKSFKQKVEGGSANCKFNDWQIGPSGDGTLVHMNIDLEGINIHHDGREKTLPNATAIVELQLEFVPHNPDLLMVGDTMPYNLVIKTQPETRMMASGALTNEPVAHVTRLLFEDGKNRFGDSAVVQACLNKWMNTNLDQFAHVFATVNLARQVADGAFSWVKPTYASYSFLGGESEDECVLAVLCMSDDRSAQHLYETVSPSALPTQTSGNFIISGERMLDQMVRNSLPAAFKGLKASDAVLSDDKRTLEVKKQVHLTDVEHDGEKYSANLLGLKIWLDGEFICVDSRTETEVSPGIYSECHSTSRYRIHLLESSKGGQTLAYTQVGESVVRNKTRHSTAVEIVKWIVIAIGVIVTAVVGVLTFGAGFIVGALCCALVAGSFALASQIPNIIEAAKKGDAPPIDILVNEATAQIHWAGDQLFKLKDAIFSDSLILSGDFV